MICKSNPSLHWSARSINPEAKRTNTKLSSRYDDARNEGKHSERRKERTIKNKSMEAKVENRVYNLQVSGIIASPELCYNIDYETCAKVKRVVPGVVCPM
jgi:hypothetical protein